MPPNNLDLCRQLGFFFKCSWRGAMGLEATCLHGETWAGSVFPSSYLTPLSNSTCCLSSKSKCILLPDCFMKLQNIFPKASHQLYHAKNTKVLITNVYFNMSPILMENFPFSIYSLLTPFSGMWSGIFIELCSLLDFPCRPWVSMH